MLSHSMTKALNGGRWINIEYEKFKNLTLKKWLKSRELETPNVETHN